MSNIIADLVPDACEIINHLRDHLGVGIRWNGLFLCFEIAFSYGNDEGQWLPASPDWRGDPLHCRVRHMLGKAACRRSLGTYQGYDAMLQRLRASRETQRHPLDHLPFVYGMEPACGPDSLVAHTAALHKAYRPLPRHLPLLTIPHEYPLMPAKWAHLQDYVFDLQPLSEACSYRLGNLWRRSGERGQRTVVMVGTPTIEQERSVILSIARPPDPEMAWQEAAESLGLRWGMGQRTVEMVERTVALRLQPWKSGARRRQAIALWTGPRLKRRYRNYGSEWTTDCWQVSGRNPSNGRYKKSGVSRRKTRHTRNGGSHARFSRPTRSQAQ